MHPRELQGHTHAFTDWCVGLNTKLHSNIVQYANERMNDRLYRFSRSVIQTLDPNNTYLNVGTGVGFLEYCAREANISMKTLDRYFEDGTARIDADNAIRRTYGWWCRKLKINVDYRIANYHTNVEIKGPLETFDEAICIRFGPFQGYYPEAASSFFNAIKTYTKCVRVYDISLDNNTLKYFKDNYKVHEIGDDILKYFKIIL